MRGLFLGPEPGGQAGLHSGRVQGQLDPGGAVLGQLVVFGGGLLAFRRVVRSRRGRVQRGGHLFQPLVNGRAVHVGAVCQQGGQQLFQGFQAVVLGRGVFVRPGGRGFAFAVQGRGFPAVFGLDFGFDFFQGLGQDFLHLFQGSAVIQGQAFAFELRHNGFSCLFHKTILM